MFDLIIVGAGPAGIGLLSSLYRKLETDSKRALKLCLIDAADCANFGQLASYNINSDTRAEKFLTCLNGLPPSITTTPKLTKLTQVLRLFGSQAAPLPQVGEFYKVLGNNICQDMILKDLLQLRKNTSALSATWYDGHWRVKTVSNGVEEIVITRQLALACGATETEHRLHVFLETHDLNTGDLKSYALSSDILKALPEDFIFKKLRMLRAPKVVVIGGSHSAISVAAKLLSQNIPFVESGITIVHRSPMQATFESADEAIRQGFTDFDEDDICPHTRRVYALKGFRLESRDLFCAIKGYGDMPLERRVKLSHVNPEQMRDVKSNLQNADLVVSALGYTPDYFDLYDEKANQKITLNGPNYVDEMSRLLDFKQTVIPNCYALGLATNYNLSGRFGEPSFKGQANGLVLWHKQIGTEIASMIIGG